MRSFNSVSVSCSGRACQQSSCTPNLEMLAHRPVLLLSSLWLRDSEMANHLSSRSPAQYHLPFTHPTACYLLVNSHAYFSHKNLPILFPSCLSTKTRRSRIFILDEKHSSVPREETALEIQCRDSTSPKAVWSGRTIEWFLQPALSCIFGAKKLP